MARSSRDDGLDADELFGDEDDVAAPARRPRRRASPVRRLLVGFGVLAVVLPWPWPAAAGT